jgi:hypothetical protein
LRTATPPDAFQTATDANRGAGEIGGLTLEAGLYKVELDRSISSDVHPDRRSEVFIFQIAGPHAGAWEDGY